MGAQTCQMHKWLKLSSLILLGVYYSQEGCLKRLAALAKPFKYVGEFNSGTLDPQGVVYSDYPAGGNAIHMNDSRHFLSLVVVVLRAHISSRFPNSNICLNVQLLQLGQYAISVDAHRIPSEFL